MRIIWRRSWFGWRVTWFDPRGVRQCSMSDAQLNDMGRAYNLGPAIAQGQRWTVPGPSPYFSEARWIDVD